MSRHEHMQSLPYGPDRCGMATAGAAGTGSQPGRMPNEVDAARDVHMLFYLLRMGCSWHLS